MGAIDDVQGAVKHLRVQRIEQKTGFARNRTTGNGADKMAEQAVADARIKNDGHRTRGKIHRVEPRNGPFSRFLTYIFRILEIFEKAHAVIGIVAFHTIAFPGNNAG